MEEQLITFETGILAKEKGFNIPVKYGVYGKSMKLCYDLSNKLTNWNNKSKQQKHSNATSIPTQSFLQDWLREEYNISVWVSTGYYMGKLIYDTLISYIDEETGEFKEIVPILSNKMKHDWGDTTYENKYSDALEKGLKEALPLIKNKVNLK